MFKMFAQFFVSMTTLFMALEKSAKAVDHLSSWAEESAGSFADEARMQREKRMSELKKQLTAK